MKQSVISLPVFQVIGYEVQEVASQHTVNYTMVIRQGQIHLMTDSNRITFRCLYYGRLLLNISHSQNGNLG